MASELAKRVAVAGVGVPLAVVVVYAGGWLLAGVLAVIAALAAGELYRMAAQRGVRAFGLLGATAAALCVLSTQLATDPMESLAWSWVILLATTLYVATAAIFRRGVDGQPLASAAVTVFGAILTGGTLAYALFLRDMDIPEAYGDTGSLVGPALVAFPLALTWIGDSCAYFGGRAFGKRKLIPSVSPGKTIAGAVTSVVGTLLVGALYAQFVLNAWLGVPISLLAGAVIGLIVSPAAQIGDLAESLLKREAGVKDSGSLLPGHGGVLDRFDSLFFTIPVTYWLLALLLARDLM